MSRELYKKKEILLLLLFRPSIMCAPEKLVESSKSHGKVIEETLGQLNGLRFSDAHCHISLGYFKKDGRNSIEQKVARVDQYALMATDVDDFDVVEAKHLQHTESLLGTEEKSVIVPAFGVHPWFSYRYYVGVAPESKLAFYQKILAPVSAGSRSSGGRGIAEEVLDKLPDPRPMTEVVAKLEILFSKYGTAMLGECGLDRPFRVLRDLPYTVKLDHQQAVLSAQLKVASRYGRCVSVHCVKAHMPLYEILKEETGLANVSLHSYSGSAEFLGQTYFGKKSMMRNKTFVSCSKLFNDAKRFKLEELLKVLPREAVLLETDVYVDEVEVWEAMSEKILSAVSEVWGVSKLEVIEKVQNNFNRFVGY